MKRPPGNDLIPISSHVSANEAGLRWLETLKANADPQEKLRCILGPAWLCPFALKNQGWPCQHPDPANRRRCVDIYQITYTCTTELISGQLKLFENNWQRVCRQHKTGAIVHDPKPSQVLRVCEVRSVAFLKWFKHHQDWHPVAWKILPCSGNAAERMEWAWQMQAKHKNIKPCVFEEL